jgi:hypothetical protein
VVTAPTTTTIRVDSMTAPIPVQVDEAAGRDHRSITGTRRDDRGLCDATPSRMRDAGTPAALHHVDLDGAARSA